MLEKLQAIARRLDQVERQLSDPAVYADRESLTRLSREQKELTPHRGRLPGLAAGGDGLRRGQELLSDPEMRELAQEELHRARQERDRLSEELKRLLLPRDPNDDRNVILEVRAGIGGEEGPCLRRTCCGCTPCMPSAGAGTWSWCMKTPRSWAASRRPAPPSRARGPGPA